MPKPLPLPPVERLRELLDYNPETGELSHRGTGKEAVQNGRYMVIYIDGKRFKAHRVIWKMMTGDDPLDQVDHWNRGGTDNRWRNLRLASHAQNQHNRYWPHRPGLSRGIELTKEGTYRARIQFGRRTVSLGTFATAEEADRAYLAEATKSKFLVTDDVPAYIPSPPKPRPVKPPEPPVPAQPKAPAKPYYRPDDDWLIVRVVKNAESVIC